jgi:hypothetical protein
MGYTDPDKQREYQREWVKKRRQQGLINHDCYRERNREYVIHQKAERDNRCMDCHRVFPYFVLDFDHREDQEKFNSLSKMVSSKWRLARLDEEIQKCDLVCANCHRVRTHERGYVNQHSN